jgi:SprT-like family
MNNAALLALSASDLASFALPPAAGPSSDAASVSPYDVANALRAVIQQDGTEGAKLLYVAFDVFNRAFFGGALPPATLLWTAPGSPRAYADHIAADEHGIRFRIRVSPSICKYGAKFVLDVVLHEMVHAACNHLDRDGEPGYKGHGPKFAARCNAIGKLLGLAEVSPKGRGGKPDCAQWPLNVRPLGYYGENDPRAVKTKSPDQGESTDDRGGSSERGPSRAERYEAAMRDAMQLIDEGRAAEARARLEEALS